MIQIRNGVFETNSSSTHSLVMCMKDDYDKWANREVYLNNEAGWSSYSEYKNKQFVTKEEAIDIITNNKYPPDIDLFTMNNDELEEYFKDNEIYTFDNYDNDYLESFTEEFTTPNGDTVVSFGQYGYDG